MNIDMYRVFFDVQKKHWWFYTRKQIVLDTIRLYFNKTRPSNILDIGCGSGLMLNALASLGQTYGMDMSDDAIRFSKEIFDGTVKQGFLPNELPFEGAFFNLVTALDVIEHVDEDDASLISIKKLLAQNGVAIITVPAYMFLWSRFDELNEHKRRYTLKELKQKLDKAGFVVEKISYYNTLLFPIVFCVRMINNILKRDGSSDVEMPNPPLNFILKKIFGLEKYILRYISFPFGVSIIAVVRSI